MTPFIVFVIVFMLSIAFCMLADQLCLYCHTDLTFPD
jgi:hypothetical protein